MALGRHLGVFWESWKQERAKPKSTHAESEFLPAALEILETPPRPMGRIVLWLLTAFIGIAIAWAFIGRVDIVAIAEGRLAPLGRVKVIQSADQGIVRAIHVRDGDPVKAGQALIALDPTVSESEVIQAQEALRVAELDRARAQALLDSASGKAGVFVPPDGVDPEVLATQLSIVEARIREHRAGRASLVQESTQAGSSLRMVEADLERIRQQLPLIETQLQGLRTLEQKGLSPRMRVMEVEERAVGLRSEFIVRDEEASRARSAVAGAQQKLAQFDGAFQREALDAFNEADATARLRREELTIKQQRNALTVLTAPEDGVIQQMQVATIGGVVKPADPLMIVVPKDGDIVVDAFVLNRDAGFVREGQSVEVKLEAYPFTRYGIIAGVLEHISRDAIQDEQRGLVYAARVRLKDKHIMLDGKPMPLATGLAAQVEIKTGKRRIIDFILSPLARRSDEAGRER
jgi:hemolysin D